MMKKRFSQLRHPEIKQAAQIGAVLVLPLGQTEEHGPHLPINTDTLIAVRLCEEAIRRLGDQPPAFLMDEVCYGFSQKVMKEWPGTFVVPQEILIAMLKHVLVSAVGMGFRKVVLVSTHGNHDGVARVVARDVADACGIGPGVVFPFAFVGDILREHGKAGPGGSCHACEMETSLMLHLHPARVKLSRAKRDGPKQTDAYRKADLMYGRPVYFVNEFHEVTKTGTIGRPELASAEKGRRFLEGIVKEVTAFVDHFAGW